MRLLGAYGILLGIEISISFKKIISDTEDKNAETRKTTNRRANRRAHRGNPIPKADGNGLYIVSDAHKKNLRWVWRFTDPDSGLRSALGFGPYPKVSALDARYKALTNQKMLTSGQNPAEVKRNLKTKPTKLNLPLQRIPQDIIFNDGDEFLCGVCDWKGSRLNLIVKNKKYACPRCTKSKLFYVERCSCCEWFNLEFFCISTNGNDYCPECFSVISRNPLARLDN